jgi:hypothetical protein
MYSDHEDHEDLEMRKFMEEHEKLEQDANLMFNEIKTKLYSNKIEAIFEKSHSPLGIRVLVGSSKFSCTAPFCESDNYELARITILDSKVIEIENIGYFDTAEELCTKLCTILLDGHIN